jgi:hypothetical protein
MEVAMKDVLCGIVTAAVVVGGSVARAELPRLGEVRKAQVITLSLQAGSTEKETKQVVYTPPPGWYVRSHEVRCTARTGNSSFTVNTVPRDWAWSSEEKVSESYRALIELAGKADYAGMQARFATERDRILKELRKVRSTHHALVVEATAKGEGFLRRGGGVELTVTAELVYLGTDEALTALLAAQRVRVK